MIFDDLALQPTTRLLLESYVKSPVHAVLLFGATGSGLGTLSRRLAEKIVLDRSDIHAVLPDEKGSIGIERVRALYNETHSIRSSRQVVIIDDLDRMGNDAQNAFLKLLEEPNSQVCFVLTSHKPETLLPTISSRTQQIEVRPISTTDSESLLRKNHVSNATSLQQMLFLGSGFPAELVRLATDEAYFAEKARLVRLARDFLTAPLYERLLLIGPVKERDEALTFLRTLAAMIQFSAKKDTQLLTGPVAEQLERTTERLERNGHVRTQLTNLAFHV